MVAAITSGSTDVRDILAAVTRGGGKSLLPVLAAAKLVKAGLIDRVCWVVPRDSLRLQAEEAFADPVWRRTLDHALSVRAADNTADPSRGLAGYVTTYQGIAAAPGLHLAEFRRYRTLLVVDEVHHLPALADTDPVTARQFPDTDDDPASAWSQALQPLFECAAYRLLLSGTLERADGKGILWLPYRKGPKARTREVELDAPGWAVVGYSRRQALAERAVLPVTFGALDGEASWRDEEGRDVGPHRLAAAHPEETTRPALFTALRTGFAEALLREAFLAIRGIRADRRRDRGLAADAPARGLGKLLVVAPDQSTARRYNALLQGWLPAGQANAAQLATSDTPGAHEILAAFRLRSEPSILVTVAMAYEGLDAPEVAVVAALTHIRSRAWLEQMVARATRVDPNAGPYAAQRALVFHPDDPLFAQFRRRMEIEQGTLARAPKPARGRGTLPDWLLDRLPPEKEGITPLVSNALALRFDTLRPGPDLAMHRPDQAAAQSELIDPPSVVERRLRTQLGEMVAAQAVEDEAGSAGLRGGVAGVGLYHRYNAALKRVTGNKSRAEMTLPELEVALGWLERNRLSGQLHVLDGDPRYAWTARKRGEWKPPVGRLPLSRATGVNNEQRPGVGVDRDASLDGRGDQPRRR